MTKLEKRQMEMRERNLALENIAYCANCGKPFVSCKSDTCGLCRARGKDYAFMHSKSSESRQNTQAQTLETA